MTSILFISDAENDYSQTLSMELEESLAKIEANTIDGAKTTSRTLTIFQHVNVVLPVATPW